MMKNHVRYFIIFMLFFVSSINYGDRATVSFAQTNISKDLGLDAQWMGLLMSAWGWSYVIAQLPAGWLLDRFGSKRVYGIAFFLWSFFIFLMGFSAYLKGKLAFAVLFGLFFLTGFALAPCFPGNGRFVAAWFPTKERGLASAIFNSSQYFSLVLFSPLIGWIVGEFGWKYVFWIMGGIGIILTPIWFKTIYSPRDHPSVAVSELRYIEEGGGLVNMDMSGQAGARFSVRWSHIRQLLGSRMLLGVYAGQFFITTLTYFFLQWFPSYLEKRGMPILKVGLIAPLPALCGFIGGILGGRVSDLLLHHRRSLTFSRKAPIVFGMLLSAAMLVVCNHIQKDWIVVVALCLAFFGKGIGALGWTVVSDTSPKEIMGLSGGLFNMFGNTAAITTALVIGHLTKAPGGFSKALVFAGANGVAAVVCYVLIVGEIKRLELRTTDSSPSPQPAVR